MRVFVAGASGAIGTRLVAQLVERGHEVVGSFRSPGHGRRVEAFGAQPVQLDLLGPLARQRECRDALAVADDVDHVVWLEHHEPTRRAGRCRWTTSRTSSS